MKSKFDYLKEIIADTESPREKNIDKIKMLLKHNIEAVQRGFDDLALNIDKIFSETITVNNVRAKHKLSLISLACHYNNYHAAELLIQYGANVNTRDENGPTALYLAIDQEEPNLKLIKLLCDQYIEINFSMNKAPGCAFTTPLQLAIVKENIELIKLLLLSDAYAVKRNSLTTTDVFKDHDRLSIEYFTKKHGPTNTDEILNLLNCTKYLQESRTDFLNSRPQASIGNFCFAFQKNPEFVLQYITESVRKANLQNQGLRLYDQNNYGFALEFINAYSFLCKNSLHNDSVAYKKLQDQVLPELMGFDYSVESNKPKLFTTKQGKDQFIQPLLEDSEFADSYQKMSGSGISVDQLATAETRSATELLSSGSGFVANIGDKTAEIIASVATDEQIHEAKPADPAVNAVS